VTTFTKPLVASEFLRDQNSLELVLFHELILRHKTA
jgi:hypothetical protein